MGGTRGERVWGLLVCWSDTAIPKYINRQVKRAWKYFKIECTQQSFLLFIIFIHLFFI